MDSKPQNMNTLVMLLSLAKLQRGQTPVNGFDKRWQTPEDVLAQIKEAMTFMHAAGRKVDKVVLLYTDTLYLNSDQPAIGLIQKSQDQTLTHRRKLQELLAKDTGKLPVEEMLWSELVQGQKDYQSPRTKMKEAYESRAAFREAVQTDNPKRKGTLDPIPDGAKKGSPPTEADMFVLEEVSLFDGLAKGHVVSNKIDPNSNIVIVYPGPLMQSLALMQQTNMNIHKGRPSAMRHVETTASWLDVSDPMAARESVYCISPPNPEAVKKHEASVRQHEAKRRMALHQRIARTAVAAALSAMAVAAPFLLRFQNKDQGPSLRENDYQASVSYEQSGQPMTVRFKKDAPDQAPESWTASTVQYGPEDPGRPLIYRDDVAYIQNALAVVAQANSKAR